MNILMMTNTYEPHVGGVARSVAAFSEHYRDAGHKVIVVAPEFEGMPARETDVIRVPAIQKFNGSDFSVVLPIPGFLDEMLAKFKPDIVHSHHPFLIGSTALRIAAQHHLPHVFTHHTRYEDYTHYVPGDSQVLKRFVVQLATHYANLCTQVFAPSESIANLLRQRQVITPISVVPTGVQLDKFTSGSGGGLRQIFNIPESAFVVGHVGRLASEKNLLYLAQALSIFLANNLKAFCLIIGVGPLEDAVKNVFIQRGVNARVIMLGQLTGQFLVSAYKAMDVFAFSSYSETQGMVITEAMAAGVPVIALDAPGVRDAVHNHQNGRLLENISASEFAAVIQDFSQLSEIQTAQFRRAALKTAEEFSMQHTAQQALTIYQQLITTEHKNRPSEDDVWSGLLPRIKAEWDLIVSYAQAATESAFADETNPDKGHL